MGKFSGSLFCVICAYLNSIVKDWQSVSDHVPDAQGRAKSIRNIRFVAKHCREAGLTNIAAYIDHQIKSVDVDGTPYSMFVQTFGSLHGMLESEMKSVKFLRIERDKFYGDTSLFEPYVTDIYPVITYDIVEAGNCLALERSTACAFHLMRVVEFGVQRFGHKLGVQNVSDTVWQVILDQINAAIKHMPEKPSAKKRVKEQYADVAAHLYNVKVAQRNTVMHPKRTYTPQESERLFEAVRAFMETLVVLLNPRRVKRLKEMAEIFSSNEEVVLDAMGLGKGANGDEEQ